MPSRRRNVIRVVVCPLGKPAVVKFVEPTLPELQKLVGGQVETAYVSPGIELVADEGGAFRQAFNREVPAKAPPVPPGFEDAVIISAEPGAIPPGSEQWGVHRVHGPFFLCRPGLTSLTPKDADELAAALNRLPFAPLVE